MTMLIKKGNLITKQKIMEMAIDNNKGENQAATITIHL